MFVFSNEFGYGKRDPDSREIVDLQGRRHPADSPCVDIRDRGCSLIYRHENRPIAT